MTPAFGFSVGDFIAVVRLLIDGIRALDDCRGSSSQYLELINELRNLELTLIHVISIHDGITDISQQQTLQSRVVDCRRSIDRFLSKIRKYDGSLGIGGSTSACKDAFRKIQWRLCAVDELQLFRATIASHVQGIQVLIAITQISNSKKAIASLSLQSDGISQIQSSLGGIQGSMFSLTSSLDSMTLSASNASAHSDSRLQSILNSQCKLESLIQQLLAQKETAIPAQVLLQQPIIFLDAMNRRMSLQLDWIDSWDAFLAVLKIRFKDSGLSKIEAGEYAIQATTTSRDIPSGRPWNVTFFPGQSYDMSMLFRDSDNGALSYCPHCRYECLGDTSVDTTCPNCNATFRRIIDEYHSIHSTAANAPEITKSATLTSPVPQPKYGEHGVVCIQDFLRVRLFHQVRIETPISGQSLPDITSIDALEKFLLEENPGLFNSKDFMRELIRSADLLSAEGLAFGRPQSSVAEESSSRAEIQDGIPKMEAKFDKFQNERTKNERQLYASWSLISKFRAGLVGRERRSRWATTVML